MKSAVEIYEELQIPDNQSLLYPRAIKDIVLAAIIRAQRDAEISGMLRAAEIADKWALSKSCNNHSDNPCCHVRTGKAIAEAIRAEADKLKGEL